jgi:hypothetical protein
VDLILIGGMAAILHGAARVTKEAAGRRKDQEAIAELRVLLEEIEKKQT